MRVCEVSQERGCFGVESGLRGDLMACDVTLRGGRSVRTKSFDGPAGGASQVAGHR
ncbi:hypothetical protein MLP_48780 [Microlunatus phosphovorus NM-1]|uniref:Uncharacterized protein n=1 Tax=Microlunatus phosphovorus (strain ATCC 700054 / DSM 10555 / JCM 9379 / NBRC 101784 / NCIMB 13414 / VKM Ac-1990 / NM-1) TaxID=1032480 RepID=F5XFV8_MICPN|nr:hypothetical protein MLP_48780 [Microlunatus phosphovorus NM-1]